MKTRPTLHTHLDAVLYYISVLDIEMVDLLLDEERTYQDFKKSVFINYLNVVFTKYKSFNNQELDILPSICYSCKKGCKIHVFIGKNSNHILPLMIETNDEQHITDMYQCFLFDNKNFKSSEILHIADDKSEPLIEDDLEPPF